MTAFADAGREGRPSYRPQPSTGAAVTIRDLGKSFGPKAVLRGFNLRSPAGQFLAVVGRSGCGKSTLLRLVTGLDRPDHGRVLFGDRPGAENGLPRRVMFQEPRLLPWATVLANVEIGLGAARGAPGGREQALETLASVGLEDRAGEWPSVLSGGQKQRVALARALVSRPGLLALDEPLGALDALTRIEMQQLLEAVWQREGFTAILVTHDVAEAVTLADRIIVLQDGAAVQDIDVDLARPRRRGSADFAALEARILGYLLGAR